MYNFQPQGDRRKIFQAKSLAKQISKEQKHEELRVESSIAQQLPVMIQIFYINTV